MVQQIAPDVMTLTDVQGRNVDNVEAALSDFIKPNRYALVWWHPQALSPAQCKTCGGNAEPIDLLMTIYANGCDVIGLTYEAPARTRTYLQDVGLEYPILTVDVEAARAHRVAKVKGESWPSMPHHVAFLVDEHLQVINRYRVGDAITFLRQVRDDVKAGPPAETWETKKTLWQRLLGR